MCRNNLFFAYGSLSPFLTPINPTPSSLAMAVPSIHPIASGQPHNLLYFENPMIVLLQFYQKRFYV